MPTLAIVWFRRDLRLADNPALNAALQNGYTPVPVYIDDPSLTESAMGAASAWWCHHSLERLQQSLRRLGSDLLLLQGKPLTLLRQLVKDCQAEAVYWNRCYEPELTQRDSDIKQSLEQQGTSVKSFNGSLLSEPWHLTKADGTPYKVFTPFWKTLQKTGVRQQIIPAPANSLPALPTKIIKTYKTDVTVYDWLPDIDWDKGFYQHWQPGEAGAIGALQQYTADAWLDYPTARDLPAEPGTSRLSPHLHFGELSPQQVWQAISQQQAGTRKSGSVKAAEAYLRQLGWRDFGHHLLYHFPHTVNQPLNQRFKVFPWKSNQPKKLRQWQQGQTGIPIVDAGMRELWQTGWMHNRVRMIVASLLTKNLLIPWQTGAAWFMDTLVDADLANNTMGWQWTAGSGADAAPYFRIFNPVRQGERFDKQGEYVRHWLPELKRLPDKYIHQPWNANETLLQDAGITLGRDYPKPIVDLAETRERALAAWQQIR